MHRKRINISHDLAGQRVGIKEVDEGIWIVTHVSGSYIEEPGGEGGIRTRGGLLTLARFPGV